MKLSSNTNLLIQVFPFVLFACIDGIVSVAYIWILLDKYHSIFDLGICLSISSLISFFIQTKVTFIKKIILISVNKFFIFQVLFAMIISIVNIYLLNYHLNKEIIMISLIIYNFLIFMNFFVIDSFLSKLILSKQISSTRGSIISQVIMQFSAIIGFSIGGRIFNIYGIQGSTFLIILLLLISFVMGNLNSFIFKTGMIKNQNIPSHNFKTKNAESSRVIHWIAAICILMISFQLANYNLFLPNIFQKYKLWTSENFGYISSVASLGGFIASFIVFKGKYFLPLIIAAATLIPIANFTLVFSNSMTWCVILSFLLGFSVNSLRSTYRKNIFDNLSSTQDISKWVSLSNLFTFLPRALFPLLAALLIENTSSAQIFPGVGLVIALFLIILTSFSYINSHSNIKMNSERT